MSGLRIAGRSDYTFSSKIFSIQLCVICFSLQLRIEYFVEIPPVAVGREADVLHLQMYKNLPQPSPLQSHLPIHLLAPNNIPS